MKPFSNKKVAEIVNVTMDMNTILNSSATPVVTVSVESGGPDPSPQALKSGAAVVVKNKVIQKLGVGGVPGCTYRLAFQVDVPSTGERLIEYATITVEN